MDLGEEAITQVSTHTEAPQVWESLRSMKGLPLVRSQQPPAFSARISLFYSGSSKSYL